MMYNRYIPQQDGTYQKNRIQTPPDQPPQKVDIPLPPAPKEEIQSHKGSESAGSFLRQLLPKDLDTGDLLIIILLLLLAGDCKDTKNTWLLTLALYLFL